MESEKTSVLMNFRVYGEPLVEVPKDLYIPPDALEVILDSFEGPLDLLIYLIRKDNFNILDIPMAKVTSQYLKYVEKIRKQNLELASEYLLMAAVLIEIKARMLLPRQPSSLDEDETEDPRTELVRQLIEYEKFKKAAKNIDQIPRVHRDILIPYVLNFSPNKKLYPSIISNDLFKSLETLFAEKKLNLEHSVTKELLSVKEHMSIILKKIKSITYYEFQSFFKTKSTYSKMSVVVYFVALLELSKSGLVKISQAKTNSTIWISDSKSDEKTKSF